LVTIRLDAAPRLCDGLRMATFARAVPVLLMSLSLPACGGDDDGVSVSGDAFLFNGGSGLDGRLPAATVTVLEAPEREVVTEVDGHYQIDGLEVGAEVTLALELENYHPTLTSTITLGDDGAERVTFQVVHDAIYDLMAEMLEIVPDEEHDCQIATTVTRVGKSLYDEGAHGEGGATVTLDPPLAGEGPVYFDASVLPDRSLTETSEDGGVLFLQVPAGDYVMTATKAGVEFAPVAITCRAGWLVNASPPYGLQAL
jgi:hypothetical protein